MDLKSVTLKKLVQDGTVTAISKLKRNTNKLYFVTLMCDKKANNVYFTKKTSLILDGTFNEGDHIVSFLQNAEVCQTESQQEGHEGENRFKLFVPGESNYSSKAELLAVFGGEEDVKDFDMNLFKEEFKAKEVLIASEAK